MTTEVQLTREQARDIFAMRHSLQEFSDGILVKMENFSLYGEVPQWNYSESILVNRLKVWRANHARELAALWLPATGAGVSPFKRDIGDGEGANIIEELGVSKERASHICNFIENTCAGKSVSETLRFANETENFNDAEWTMFVFVLAKIAKG